MPMWQHNRKPSPPPPPAPAPEVLVAARLTDAVLTGDTAAARRALDEAFWQKLDVRPDGFLLLQAAQRGDRDMVRLLATFGATWTREEAKLARLAVPDESWAKVEGPLRNAGIPTGFSDAELVDVDLFAALDWAKRSLAELSRRDPAAAQAARREVRRLCAAGVAASVQAGDMEAAADILLRRGEGGDGSSFHPLDIAEELKLIVTRNPARPEKVFALLDALEKRRLHVQPVEASGHLMWLCPGLVPGLKARNLLASGEQARIDLLRTWTALQADIDADGFKLKLDPAFVEAQHARLREVAKALFTPDRPMMAQETVAFMGIHAARARQTPEALARVERALLEMGFFAGHGWGTSQFQELAATTQDAKLREEFNRIAYARTIRQVGVKALLSPERFGDLMTAHALGACRANAQETVKILDYLQTRIKDDTVTDDMTAALKTLRDTGADFSQADPNRYFGRKGPGLAKALLDLGIVPAEAFDLSLIAQRHGSRLELITPPGAKGFRNTEFICQLFLEIAQPQKALPLRGQAGVSYQERLVREWMSGALPMRTALSYRPRKPRP